MLRFLVRWSTLAAACAAFLPTVAQAQQVIGIAARTTGTVSGQMGPRKSPITEGVNVLQNQIVTTGPASDALLNFRDSTHLEVGPSSRVTLDRYIFNPDGGARSAVMTMTTGAFRFVTGISEPRNIKLQTPQATIGIRGTILEILVENGRTNVRVVQGAITVCLRSNERECTDLISEGGSVVASSTGLEVESASSPAGQLLNDPGAREGSGGASDNGGSAPGGDTGGSSTDSSATSTDGGSGNTGAGSGAGGTGGSGGGRGP